jgi:hypothetical protein
MKVLRNHEQTVLREMSWPAQKKPDPFGCKNMMMP